MFRVRQRIVEVNLVLRSPFSCSPVCAWRGRGMVCAAEEYFDVKEEKGGTEEVVTIVI